MVKNNALIYSVNVKANDILFGYISSLAKIEMKTYKLNLALLEKKAG